MHKNKSVLVGKHDSFIHIVNLRLHFIHSFQLYLHFCGFLKCHFQSFKKAGSFSKTMLCCSEIGPMRWSCQCHISSVFCLPPPSALHIKLSACQSWFACASKQLIQTWHLNRILAMKHRKGCMCEKVLCKRRDVKNRVREQHVPLEEWKKEKA